MKIKIKIELTEQEIDFLLKYDDNTWYYDDDNILFETLVKKDIVIVNDEDGEHRLSNFGEMIQQNILIKNETN